MHLSTMLRMEWFIKNYVQGGHGRKVLDVGSYNVNGTYRELFKDIDICYEGLDIEAGPNVDIVMDSPYEWSNIMDDSYDYIISGQAFEHIEYPWLTIQQIYKKVKQGGIICIIAPNTGDEHKYPFDCWRFFGDGMTALAKWAGFEVIDVTVGGIPDRSVSVEWDSVANDACLIAVKPGGGVPLDFQTYPKLTYERRFDPAEDNKLRYEYLYKWIHMENRYEKISKFLSEKHAENVYLYGYGYLGKMFFEDAEKLEKINWYVIDKYKKVEEKGITGYKLGEDDFEFGDNAVMIITVLDSNRDLRHYLDAVYKDVPKYYLDEIIV